MKYNSLSKNYLMAKVRVYIGPRGLYRTQKVRLAEEIMAHAEDGVNGGCVTEELLAYHVKDAVDFSDFKPKFLPSFVWIWIAQALANYIIKLIIDRLA